MRVKLIVGLGNPGSVYALTRHNIGFLAADRTAAAAGIAVRSAGYHALTGRGTWLGHDIIIAKPQTFMNNSGQAVQSIAAHHDIPADNIIVMHDDMDVAFGLLKIKIRGGSAGHLGVTSLMHHLLTDSFTRIRIGIGRPPDGRAGPEYVLEAFTLDELALLDEITASAVACVKMVLAEGPTAAMNRFHTAAATVKESPCKEP